MSGFTYKAPTNTGYMEFEIPTAVIFSVEVTVVQTEHGNPQYPKTYRPPLSQKTSIRREDLREMLFALQKVI